MQLVVTATAATITFSSHDEATAKIRDLVAQLAKLPAMKSGRKRSFTRTGLVIEIPRPTWDELVALRTRESVRDQLIAEIDQPATVADTEPEPTAEQQFESDRLAELSAELLAEPFEKMSKAELHEHLRQIGHPGKKSWTHRQLVNAALDWVSPQPA